MLLDIKANNIEILIEEISFSTFNYPSIQCTFQLKIVTLYTTTTFSDNSWWIGWQNLTEARNSLKSMLDGNIEQKIMLNDFSSEMTVAFSITSDQISALIEATIDRVPDLHLRTSATGSVDILNIVYHQLSDFILKNKDHFN